jgi:hypothetical protein
MNCPYCGSNLLEESSNFNEFTCKLCKCEFKHDDNKFRIFEEGNYKKFCENTMYHLCENASPKVSSILVSVISQLKNNGVEELDAVLEHLNLVSANVSSEMVIGLQQESDLEVVKEGIEKFTTLGQTLSKREDLELDLHRFQRFQEANAFYEKVYVSAISSPTITNSNGTFKKGAMEENEVPENDGEKTFNDIKNEVMSKNITAVLKLEDGVGAFSLLSNAQGRFDAQGIDSVRELKDFISYIEGPIVLYVKNGPNFTKKSEGTPDVILKDLTSQKSSMEENEMDGLTDAPATPPTGPSGFDDSGIAPGNEVPPVEAGISPEDMAASFAPVQPNQTNPVVTPPTTTPVAPLATQQPTPFEEEMLEKIACEMAKCYQEGNIAMEADFMESLLNSESVRGICENIGEMDEDTVYKVAEMVANKLQPQETETTPEIEGNEEVSDVQLQEALEILSKSAKLSEEELKDL